MSLSGWASADVATPLLRCQARYVSETVLIEAHPSADPYSEPTHAVGKRFQFKAVVSQVDGRPQTIALYTYDMELPESPVLLHEAVYTAPFAPGRDVPALTGWQHVYSSRLGREMVYGCAWLEAGS